MTKVKKGFTLIEVILVLAIAAMIFLMVLLTLPAVQRAQRDMARKEDVGKMVAAFTEFVGNNRGTQPKNAVECQGGGGSSTDTCELDPYVRLADGGTYSIVGPVASAMTPGTTAPANAAPTNDNITIYRRANCGTNGDVVPGTSSRQIAVVVELEGAGADGQAIYYCQES